MKYLCSILILLLFANISIADDQSIGVDPNDIDGEAYIDPYDVEGGGHVVPQTRGFVDPYDQPVEVEKKAKSSRGLLGFNKKLLNDADKSWEAWKKRNLKSTKPPLNWSQVGSEIGAGYVGAFGGSVLGLFSGFLIGSVYDASSDCDRCWVNVAANMATLGAGLGATAGVYMFGNNDKQLGSISATYVATLLPILVGTVMYTDSKQINKSGFYLATMPLLAVVGYNLTRYYRGKDDKPLFENIFIDDLWVSKSSDNTLALNIKLKF